MYLPLDKLMERVKPKGAANGATGSGAAARSDDDSANNSSTQSAPAATDTSRVPAMDDPTRSRDFMRNRDSSSN